MCLKINLKSIEYNFQKIISYEMLNLMAVMAVMAVMAALMCGFFAQEGGGWKSCFVTK